VLDRDQDEADYVEPNGIRQLDPDCCIGAFGSTGCLLSALNQSILAGLNGLIRVESAVFGIVCCWFVEMPNGPFLDGLPCFLRNVRNHLSQ
jgi:hypothetical protein